MKVPFNEPFANSLSLNLHKNDPDILRTQGKYYQACTQIIKKKLGFKNIILTPSCTDALELIALTIDIKKGDEVILPSYTYVSTANAFALRGAKLVFVDTYSNHPSIDISKIEKAITRKTKAIIIVHYGGIAINYPQLKKIKKKYSIPIIEDAAHCFGSKSGEEFIGSVGDFAAFSFHETKNISCGQGGAVIINNQQYIKVANIISQCGTDKLDFINKKLNYYSWKNLGSNFLLAEPICVILLANLKLLEKINEKRRKIWKEYYKKLKPIKENRAVQLPPFKEGINGNGHIFYIITKDIGERNCLIDYLKAGGIEATFHYYPLHLTSYFLKNNPLINLKNTEKFGKKLIRLPLFYKLKKQQQEYVIEHLLDFYRK